MDVISYGVANKAAKQEKDTRNNVLGVGIEGSFSHARARIDNLETALQGVVGQADKLIINDAINIMKANAKFNAVAKTIRYKHQNMVFEDFLDAAGIDAGKSSGYTLDTTNGLVKASGAGSYTVVTTVENADAVPEKAILVVEETILSLNLIPKMTGYTTPSGEVKESSHWGTNPHRYGWLAFNRSNIDAWDGWTSNNVNAWIQYDFKGPTIINKYTITPSPESSVPTIGSMPGLKWKLQGSNDGVNYSTIHDQNIGITSDQWLKGKQEFVCDNASAFNIYRLQFENTGAVYLGEIEMMESVSQTIQGTYFLSRDGGVIFEPITPETLFYFQDSISPKDTKLVLKAELPANVQLLNYGLTWS